MVLWTPRWILINTRSRQSPIMVFTCCVALTPAVTVKVSWCLIEVSKLGVTHLLKSLMSLLLAGVDMALVQGGRRKKQGWQAKAVIGSQGPAAASRPEALAQTSWDDVSQRPKKGRTERSTGSNHSSPNRGVNASARSHQKLLRSFP